MTIFTAFQLGSKDGQDRLEKALKAGQKEWKEQDTRQSLPKWECGHGEEKKEGSEEHVVA